jgi:hypothetical protein
MAERGGFELLSKSGNVEIQGKERRPSSSVSRSVSKFHTITSRLH